MGQEKSQSSNDSQLASGLDAGAFPSPAGSPGARAGVDGQSRRRGMERLTGRELSSQWSSRCHFPGTGEGSPYCGGGEGIRMTGLEGLPGCKWILSSPQGLPRVIRLCLILFRSPHLGNQHLPKPNAYLWLFPNPSKWNLPILQGHGRGHLSGAFICAFSWC